MKYCKIENAKDDSDAMYISACWDKGINKGCIHGQTGVIYPIIHRMLCAGDPCAKVIVSQLGASYCWTFHMLYYKNKRIGCIIVSFDDAFKCAEFLYMYIEESMQGRGLGSIFQSMIEEQITSNIPNLEEFKIRCFSSSLAGQAIANKLGYRCVSISPNEKIQDYRKDVGFYE